MLINIRDIALDETVFKNKEAKMSNQSYFFKITLMNNKWSFSFIFLYNDQSLEII